MHRDNWCWYINESKLDKEVECAAAWSERTHVHLQDWAGLDWTAW